MLAFLLISLSFSGCVCGAISEHINKIRNDPEEKLTQAAIFRIFNNGKRSIPLLIEVISEKRYFRYRLNNPDNPTTSKINENIGYVYAYLIELILGKEELELIVTDDDFLGSKKNYVYWEGIVAFQDPEETALIDEHTLFEIQYLYRRWWKNNNHKSLRQLRDEWKRGSRPLTHSRFCWK